MDLEAVIECVWRWTWRLGSSKIGDALGDREIDVNSEMYLEAVIQCYGGNNT